MSASLIHIRSTLLLRPSPIASTVASTSGFRFKDSGRCHAPRIIAAHHLTSSGQGTTAKEQQGTTALTILAPFALHVSNKTLSSSSCWFRYYNLVVLRGTPFPATGTTIQYLITRTKQHTQQLTLLSKHCPKPLRGKTNDLKHLFSIP